MSSLLLARRYLTYHRGRSTLLVLALALALLLPLCVQILVSTYGAVLASRAEATPLVVGAPGSRYDLVLNTLYFRGRVPRPTHEGELETIADSGLGLPIPVLARRTAGGRPLVGTSLDYFAFRDLRVAAGALPGFLGEAVLGAEAARALELAPGDTLLSDRGNLYDLASDYPLRLRVAGVLAEAGTPDDGAVFVDVRTAWILEGIGHGHVAGPELDADSVLERRPDADVLNASVVAATEITPDNIDSFHFHGAPEDFPLTGILIQPASAKGATLLKGRYRVATDAQALVPTEVVDELVGFVFQLKSFFDANAALVGVSTGLLLGLVVLLDLRVRRREMQTLLRIGCPRLTIARLVATELGIVLAASIALAFLAAAALAALVQRYGIPT